MCHGCQEINSFEGSPTSFTRGPWMMLKTQSIRRIGPWSCEMLRYNCDNETKWPKIKNVRKRKTSDKIEKVLLRKDFRRLLRLFLQLGLVVQVIMDFFEAFPRLQGQPRLVDLRRFCEEDTKKQGFILKRLIGFTSLEVRNWELQRRSCDPVHQTWKNLEVPINYFWL